MLAILIIGYVINEKFSWSFTIITIAIFSFIGYMILKPKRLNMSFDKYYILDTNILLEMLQISINYLRIQKI